MANNAHTYIPLHDQIQLTLHTQVTTQCLLHSETQYFTTTQYTYPFCMILTIDGYHVVQLNNFHNQTYLLINAAPQRQGAWDLIQPTQWSDHQ
jgi:hypothetical protein